eukprot:scaffold2163_cov267-Alexandrium_tamarense.AAC.2
MVEVVQIRIRVPPGSFNQWQRLCADRDDEASPDEPVDSNVSSASSTQCSSSTIHANAPTPSPSDSPTTPRRTTQMSPVNIKASWDDKFNELVAFKTKFGHFNVKNKQLGSWVNRQRQFYKHRQKGNSSEIGDLRVKQLEDIGFHWAATDETNEQSTTTRKKKSSKVSWEERFNELKKFKAKTGHCVVPQDYSENKSLGQWVHNQRKFNKHRTEGKKSSLDDPRKKLLDDPRKKLLDDIGFQWSIRSIDKSHYTKRSSWEKRFEELVQYKAKAGDCRVPRNFTENEQLGKWVGNLRQHYKQRLEGKKNSLNDSRVKRLGDLGFEWSLRRRHTTTKLVSWEDRFNELKELYARHGQCNVSKSIDKKQLGHWISNVSLYTPVGPIFMPKSSVSPRDYFVNSNVSSTETV